MEIIESDSFTIHIDKCKNQKFILQIRAIWNDNEMSLTVDNLTALRLSELAMKLLKLSLPELTEVSKDNIRRYINQL